MLRPCVLLCTALFVLTPVAAAEALAIPSAALDAGAPPTPIEALAADRPVQAAHAMVVSAQHLATEVGVAVLRDGGNAVDAAVAIGYALAVVHPCCGNLGGGGFLLAHMADGQSYALNFRERAPLAARPDLFLDAQGRLLPGVSTDSWRAVAVPGTVAGLEAARERLGRLSRQRLLQPAIDLARSGYVLQEGDARILQRRSAAFAREANVAAIFLRDGQPWTRGERLVQAQLARSLTLIQRDGPRAFYRGPLARALVAASQAHGGLLSADDLAQYTVRWEQPLRCNYRGRTVLTPPPPSSGGVALCQTLALIEPWPLAHWGYASVPAMHHLAEALRRAFADRNTYLGDPDFVTNPVARLLDPGHIERLRQNIDAAQATPSTVVAGSLGADEGEHTTHYSVVDAAGNAVSVTYTLNYLFGAARIAGETGFLLNNEMDDFALQPGAANSFGLVQAAVNRVEGGKRPASSMTPTILLTPAGQPELVTGSPGGSTIISTVLGNVVNVLDFGMNLQQAVNAPRLHMQWQPDQITVEPGLLSASTRQALQALGHAVRELPAWGAAEAIQRTPDGMLHGANDRRRPAGRAAGY